MFRDLVPGPVAWQLFRLEVEFRRGGKRQVLGPSVVTPPFDVEADRNQRRSRMTERVGDRDRRVAPMQATFFAQTLEQAAIETAPLLGVPLWGPTRNKRAKPSCRRLLGPISLSA